MKMSDKPHLNSFDDILKEKMKNSKFLQDFKQQENILESAIEDKKEREKMDRLNKN